VALTLLVRIGRSPEYKRGLLKHLWELLQDATGAPDDQIVLGIQEVPPDQAMEMGQIMPDVSGPPLRRRRETTYPWVMLFCKGIPALKSRPQRHA
jgi:phenylpyruvate tautomerase PptA (4-oxalocrotonate tautomerase family)